MSRPIDPSDLLPLAALARVDQACDAFEAAWRRGGRPQLEDYLGGSEGERPVWLRRLLEVEVELRHGQGETPRPDDYLERFPEHQIIIEAVLADASDATSTLGPWWVTPTTAMPPMPADPSPMVATRLGPLPRAFAGRYQLLRKLGKGGMGSVYLAEDSQLKRLVALKIPHSPGDDPASLDRFLREAQAPASCHHPNICPVYDVGQAEGVLFVTMLYIEGPTLAEVIAGAAGPISQTWAAAVVRKVALAMHEAHSRGVIHRDLKPSNILMKDGKEPVVSDFGLARRIQESAPTLPPGMVVGTPAYMSPEQGKGDVGAVGPASDIWALGVILYELLTARLPFQKANLFDLLVQIGGAPPTPPSRHRPDLDPRLEAICLQALAQAPDKRHLSMTALARELRQVLEARSEGGQAQKSNPELAAPAEAGGKGPLEEALDVVTRCPCCGGSLDADAASCLGCGTGRVWLDILQGQAYAQRCFACWGKVGLLPVEQGRTVADYHRRRLGKDVQAARASQPPRDSTFPGRGQCWQCNLPVQANEPWCPHGQCRYPLQGAQAQGVRLALYLSGQVQKHHKAGRLSEAQARACRQAVQEQQQKLRASLAGQRAEGPPLPPPLPPAVSRGKGRLRGGWLLWLGLITLLIGWGIASCCAAWP